MIKTIKTIQKFDARNWLKLFITGAYMQSTGNYPHTKNKSINNYIPSDFSTICQLPY
jgi:hypothetical protein